MLDLAPDVFEDGIPTAQHVKISEGSDDEQYSSDESVPDDITNDSGDAHDQYTLQINPQTRVH